MSKDGKIYLKNFQPHPYKIDKVDLDFTLNEDVTLVSAKLRVAYNVGNQGQTDLVLDGEDLELLEISLKKDSDADFCLLHTDNYALEQNQLTIKWTELPQSIDQYFYVKTLVKIHPSQNTHLSGLYKSQSILCTQCEAEGFRRITFYIDRPDNMAIFTATLRANKFKYPVLLCNGNEVERNYNLDGQKNIYLPEELSSMHEVQYHDPWPKPSYLFAIVAGDLFRIANEFTTCTNMKVQLNLWCEPKHGGNLLWSLDSLQKAMKWDEDVFDRVFDLSAFHLVAVPHFNMGAMENKGLNIFNSSCLLVSKDTATDNDFENCMACVAHEYFHNWTGNRVTCRDWFQLVVKEGLTTYREQLFTQQYTSEATTRIAQVNVIKSLQFVEDSSPLAHAVVPESYTKIDNMYTITVYRKGPEIIRMYSTILGDAGFRKGMDLYFQRHDGQGVTYQDFHRAMEDANQQELPQLMLWFTQVGTPTVYVNKQYYDPTCKTYTLSFEQQRPDKSTTGPLLIPIKIGLIGKTSKTDILKQSYLFKMVDDKQDCTFTDVAEDVVPSILRGFSAPVRLICPNMQNVDYAFLMQWDTDPVNKWEAAQKLYRTIIIETYNLNKISKISSLQDALEKNAFTIATVQALQAILDAINDLLEAVIVGREVDERFVAQLITLPSESSLQKDLTPCDPDTLCDSVQLLKVYIASKKLQLFEKAYKLQTQRMREEVYIVRPIDVGSRQLRNRILAYMHDVSNSSFSYSHYHFATNLTDRFAAMCLLADRPHEAQTKEILSQHLETAKQLDDKELLQKWFQAQAGAKHVGLLSSVKELTQHPLFDFTNPNLIRSLLLVFARNLRYFHAKDGSGYCFMKEMILKLDPINPQSGASLAETFMSYLGLEENLQSLARRTLEELKNSKLSAQTMEIITKILGK